MMNRNQVKILEFLIFHRNGTCLCDLDSFDENNQVTVTNKVFTSSANKENADASNGILFCSGMIAGEGLVGILMAILAVVGADVAIDLSGVVNTGTIGGVIVFILMIVAVLKAALPKKAK